jgi:hypothetical protein
MSKKVSAQSARNLLAELHFAIQNSRSLCSLSSVSNRRRFSAKQKISRDEIKNRAFVKLERVLSGLKVH